MMTIGYTRVSTKLQFMNGKSLDAQERSIMSKYPDAVIVKEQYTGTTTDRPELDKVMKTLKSGDTLVVTKLDRLARNTVEGIKIISNLFDKNIAVHVINVGLLENTNMGRFFLTILLAVAEMERNNIIERTQAGKEIARTRDGYKEGRPKKYTQTQLKMAVDLLDKYSYREVSKMTKISISTLTRAKRKMKIEQQTKSLQI